MILKVLSNLNDSMFLYICFHSTRSLLRWGFLCQLVDSYISLQNNYIVHYNDSSLMISVVFLSWCSISLALAPENVDQYLDLSVTESPSWLSNTEGLCAGWTGYFSFVIIPVSSWLLLQSCVTCHNLITQYFILNDDCIHKNMF